MNGSRWCSTLVLALAATGCQGLDGAARPAAGEASFALGGAAVDLVAIGSLSGNRGDLSDETAAPLENGAAGNLLGGLGSGLAYAANSTFIGLPDRGPNAVAYNAAVDDTASYIPRLQTLRLKLKRSERGADLPLALTPVLKRTTLLYSRSPLVYGDGVAAGLPDGAPALNGKHRFYLSGRSDNFDPNSPSTNADNARLDPESIRVSRDGSSVFISDEYGPYIYEFERASGRRIRAITVPAEFAITTLSAQGAVEIAGNAVGRISNKGMEGLAISPDGRTLFGAMQSPLEQDNGTSGGFTRILVVDLRSGQTQQFAYPLTNIGTVKKPKYPTVSDIVAVNDHEFLVDERDGKGLGDDSTAAFKKVFHIDLRGAADVSGLSGEGSLGPLAVAKTEFLDVVAVLGAHGIDANDIPAKLEGMAFGPDVVLDGAVKHTLFIANDNDFIGTVTDSNHPLGIDNANKFFVFTIDRDALPGFEAQRCDGQDDDRDDDDEGHDH